MYLKDILSFTPTNIGFLFLLIGSIDILAQGYLSGKIMPKVGEKRLIIFGFILTGIAYASNAANIVFRSVPLLIGGTIIYALGSGFLS